MLRPRLAQVPVLVLPRVPLQMRRMQEVALESLGVLEEGVLGEGVLWEGVVWEGRRFTRIWRSVLCAWRTTRQNWVFIYTFR